MCEPALKLRDALEAFVPKWEELQAKTSRELVVVAALTVATTREPRTEPELALADRFIKWAVERFGDPDPVKGALKHALDADYHRMPQEFRDLVQAAGRNERSILDVIAWTGEGDDHPMVGLLKKNLLQTVGVGGDGTSQERDA